MKDGTEQYKSLDDTMPSMKLWIFISCMMIGWMGHTGISPALAQTANSKSAGYELMTNKQLGNCIACHDMPGVQGLVSNFAPPLQGVGLKYSEKELTQWVVDARKFNPNTLMPPFGSTHDLKMARPAQLILSTEQIAQVVSTMQTWR
jgi:sulfur-oxidizing protein SoxX